MEPSTDIVVLSSDERAALKSMESQIVTSKVDLANLVAAQIQAVNKISSMHQAYNARLVKVASLHGLDLEDPANGKWQLSLEDMNLHRTAD